MLSLAKGIFEEQTNLDHLVQKIMVEAQDLLKCQRCSVYLVDNTLQGVCIFPAALAQSVMPNIGTMQCKK